jgi:hypothetical protein
MLNAKKVFRHDSATGKLINAEAVQLKGDYSAIYDAKENLKSDRYFNQNQCSIFNFFAKRRLLKDIKNKINSGDWLILNEKDFSPMMSIVKKSVFEAKFYTGTVLRGYSFVNPYEERGVIKEPATALQVTGEEGNIEAIEYFTNRYASMSRANIKESKNKSEGFVHLIMYGKEAKIKKYDYMVYSEIKQRLKILTKEQVRFGDYDFMHYK